jgi:hypothetical protein
MKQRRVLPSGARVVDLQLLAGTDEDVLSRSPERLALIRISAVVPADAKVNFEVYVGCGPSRAKDRLH